MHMHKGDGVRRIFFRDNGLSVHQIFNAWLHGNRVLVNWPQFNERRVIYTHLGRTAIVLACKLWGLKPDDEVLVPAYNCGSEVDPFIWIGAKPVLYRVDSKAQIDFEDIQKRHNSKTRILYVTHYFGWPQNLNKIAEWCRHQNIYLMEDCVLSPFSNSSNNPIGQLGDASIYSFRKTLPLPDGAALVLAKEKWEEKDNLSNPGFLTIFRGTLPFLIKWLITISNNLPINFDFTRVIEKQFITPKYKKSVQPDIPSDYYFDERIINWSISRVSKGILNNTNPAKIVRARRRNYKQLHSWINDLQRVQALFSDLPDGVCPLLMPVLVENPVYWQAELNKKGIAANRWWVGYHRNLNWEGFNEARELKNNLLTLPIHQDLNEKDIAYMGDCLKTIHKNEI